MNMKRIVLLIFINVFLTKNTESSATYEHCTSPASPSDFNEEPNRTNNGTRTVCQTEECRKIANMILENMDKSLDPCDDFYEYACRNWKKHNPIPEGRHTWDLHDIIQSNISLQVQEILKSEPKDDDILPVKIAKRWYTTCLNTDDMEKQGLNPLILTLTRMGGWPIIMDPGEWHAREYIWQNVDDQYARLIARNTFYTVFVRGITKKTVTINSPTLPSGSYKLWSILESDNRQNQNKTESPPIETIVQDAENDHTSESNDNKGERSANVRRSISDSNKSRLKRVVAENIRDKISRYLIRNGLKRDDGLRGRKTKRNILEDMMSMISARNLKHDQESAIDMQQKYGDFISQVARAIAKERGAKISEEQINQDVRDMIDFQQNLAKIIFAYYEKRSSLTMTISNFQNWYDEKKPDTVNGKINWANKIRSLFAEAGVSVDNDLEIEVLSPQYFENLAFLLDETPPRTIVNYIHWNFISNILTATTNEMRELYNVWNNLSKKKTDRSTKCSKELSMQEIMAYEYVRHHYSDNITQIAVDMINDIQKEMEHLIKESNWMEENIKNSTMLKLMDMKKFIGYPEWYKDTAIMRQYFHGLIVEKSYYENVLSHDRYRRRKNLRTLKEDDDNNNSNIWNIDPLTLNAMYIVSQNTISVTAGQFHTPFFDYNRPHAVNFGFIGFIMGHEINHGFDYSGLRKVGDFVTWLSSMVEEYSKRTQCFVDQYDDYPIDKVSGDKIENYGNRTVDENIADTMGLYAAFKGYRRREKLCGNPNLALPGLEEFTNDQLFFLSYSNLMCEASDLNPLVAAKRDYFHSTNRLRVIGPVSNSEDFARAFNCPLGTAMNPERKCNIWK